MKKEFEAGKDEEGPENIQQPMKAADENNTDGYKYNTENNGQYYTNGEYPANILLMNLQRIKDENEHKNIIDTQRHLHKIGREIIDTGVGIVAQKKIDGIEHSHTHPEEILQGSPANIHLFIFSVEDQKIEQEGNNQGNNEQAVTDPVFTHGQQI